MLSTILGFIIGWGLVIGFLFFMRTLIKAFIDLFKHGGGGPLPPPFWP